MLVACTGLHPVLLILRPIRGFGEILKIGKNIAHFTVGVWNADDVGITDIDRLFCNRSVLSVSSVFYSTVAVACTGLHPVLLILRPIRGLARY